MYLSTGFDSIHIIGKLQVKVAHKHDTPFAVRNEAEPVVTYLYGNLGLLTIKLFPKRQKNFREQ